MSCNFINKNNLTVIKLETCILNVIRVKRGRKEAFASRNIKESMLV
jgi:hypothetical protein